MKEIIDRATTMATKDGPITYAGSEKHGEHAGTCSRKAWILDHFSQEG